MADLKTAMEDIGELLFPATGELPYDLHQLSLEKAGKVLDAAAKSTGGIFSPPEQPVLVLVDRGGRREPLVILHGYEFLRLLKRSEYDL